MNKNTKGIALVALVLTILFLLVIIGTIFVLVKNKNEEASQTNSLTDNQTQSQNVNNTPEIKIPENLDEGIFVD